MEKSLATLPDSNFFLGNFFVHLSRQENHWKSLKNLAKEGTKIETKDVIPVLSVPMTADGVKKKN